MAAPPLTPAVSDEIHKSISGLLLDHCRIAYNDEAETWRDLERKAQGTAAIAGVFVAAVFLLLRDYEALTPTEGALVARRSRSLRSERERHHVDLV